jgi:outer membrane protein OmpA-like peptidoglycan-associated protein
MSDQRLTQSSEKSKQRIARRESRPDSAPSLQGGIHPILQLQRTLGNRHVTELIHAKRLTPQGTILGLQRKLTVGEAGDQYEQEADRIADQVLRMPDPAQSSPGAERTPIRPPILQRLCPQCEDELQRHPSPQDDRPTSGLDTVAGTLRQGGHPLDAATRSYFEPRFGVDFSAVRIHTDTNAAASAQAVNALAYTVGRDVVFNSGQYAPQSDSGKRLLAHELTHVVQQTQLGDTTLRRTPPVIQRLGDLTQRPALLDTRCPVPPGSPHPVAEFIEFGNRVTSLTTLDRARITNVVRNWHAAGGTETVRVDGFASRTGPDGLNWELSCGRAEAVVAELRSPLSGDPGIPDSFIVIFAHGETGEFGTEERNRRATLTLSGSTAPSPTPTPPPIPTPPPAAPAFLCGPNVTTQVVDACSLTRTTFSGWTAAQKTDVCHALNSLLTGGFAWDIVDLHNNAWILSYRPACATVGATPPCGSSVQISSDCHYAGSANYVIFGVMCKLCGDHFTSIGSADAADYTEVEMLDLINKYKGTGFTGLSTPSANFVPSQDWAKAGYHGWPSVPDPAGDRSGCSPSCPTPYGGAAFRVQWHPIGVF